MTNLDFTNLNSIFESLKVRMAQDENEKQALRNSMELKLSELTRVRESMELLDNMKAQLVKDEEKLLNEYNELLELAREKEIEEFPTID
jgi:predicted nuclease with TOPRIM domain